LRVTLISEDGERPTTKGEQGQDGKDVAPSRQPQEIAASSLIALAKKKRHEAGEDKRQDDEQRNVLVIDKPGKHRGTGDEQEKHFADAPSSVCYGLYANLQ